MIHGYRAHVDGEQRCGWRSSAGFTGGRAAAIRATFGTRSLLRTGCRCGSLSTPPRSRTATEPAWSSIKSATASRRRGRAPALGSVRGRSPGRTRTGETRRKRPFGRATRRARFEPLPRSKKGSGIRNLQNAYRFRAPSTRCAGSARAAAQFRWGQLPSPATAYPGSGRQSCAPASAPRGEPGPAQLGGSPRQVLGHVRRHAKQTFELRTRRERTPLRTREVGSRAAEV